ncbi:unnamed protein product, partial [Porites evermanni]
DSIIAGQFRFAMKGREVILQPGNMIEVPAGVVHNASVIGSESVVFFDATKVEGRAARLRAGNINLNPSIHHDKFSESPTKKRAYELKTPSGYLIIGVAILLS